MPIGLITDDCGAPPMPNPTNPRRMMTHRKDGARHESRP